MGVVKIILLAGLVFLPVFQMEGVAYAAEQDLTLGRFFTSQKERISLNFARRKAILKKRRGTKKVKKIVQENFTLNGLVMRSGGPPAVWLNGQSALTEDGGLPNGVELTFIGKGRGVKVQNVRTKRDVLLKTGQRMEGVSGEVLESYQGAFHSLKDEPAKKKALGKSIQSTTKKKSLNLPPGNTDSAAMDVIAQGNELKEKIDVINKLLNQ